MFGTLVAQVTRRQPAQFGIDHLNKHGGCLAIAFPRKRQQCCNASPAACHCIAGSEYTFPGNPIPGPSPPLRRASHNSELSYAAVGSLRTFTLQTTAECRLSRMRIYLLRPPRAPKDRQTSRTGRLD